jgi:hypothetical protein
MIFVPPRFAADAILEAADAGVALTVCITEGIPVRDMAAVHAYLAGTQTTLVGPNCPGVISPGVANVGIIPGRCARRAASVRQPFGHARLSDRARALDRRHRAVHLYRMGGDPSTASGSSSRSGCSRPTRTPI